MKNIIPTFVAYIPLYSEKANHPKKNDITLLCKWNLFQTLFTMSDTNYSIHNAR